MKVRIEREKYGHEKQVRIFHTEMPNAVAQFAMQLMEKFGTVAAIPDGEDTGGRQRCRLQTPEELVTRSFEISEFAFAQARSRGHMVQVPDLNEINKEWDEKQAAKEALAQRVEES